MSTAPANPSDGGFVSWVMSLFRARRSVQCPFCLRYSSLEAGETACNAPDGCKNVMPDLYLENYVVLPPLFVPVIGWASHGKTLSLLAMVETLKQMAKVWKGHASRPADERTLKWLRDEVARKMHGKAGDSAIIEGGTDRALQPAQILLQSNIPARWRSADHTGRTLVIRDFAGEMFKEFDWKKKYKEHLSFISTAQTVVLMFSLHHLQTRELNADNMSMSELLDSYVNSIGEAAVKKRRVNMIVNLSQSDYLLKSGKLPAHLSKYLRDDPIAQVIHSSAPVVHWTSERMARYVEEMARVSDAIKEYLIQHVDTAAQFVNVAEGLNVNLRFCLTTSTGGVERTAAAGDVKLASLRILDPLFTALEFGVKQA